MIALVVVSHSRALAHAAVGLATEMVDEADLPSIGVAAGLDETTLGTDATAVAAAITEVDNPDGVLLLLDLGSALLSAEMALELIDPVVAARVTVSSAPLVEGLVAAVVLASTGASLPDVADEAQRGLAGKQQHLGTAAADAPPPKPAEPVDEASVEIEVTNAHGLHARPAASLVSLVRSFDAGVTLTDLDSGRGPVDAASLSLVATLNAREGHHLRVGASGVDARRALDAIVALATRGFDQRAEAPATPPEARAVGSGLDVAIGPAIVVVLDVDTGTYVAAGVDDELRRSSEAVAAVCEQLRDLRAGDQGGGAEAQIFDAHLALLSDPALTDDVDAALRGGESAVEAWSSCLGRLADEFARLDDPYQRERAQDVRAVQRRLLAVLVGADVAPLDQGAGPGVLVVPELDPATAATLDPTHVLGVATVSGGATGHGVIVAKSRGFPVITSVGPAADGVVPGVLVAFDAQAGGFVVDPDDAVQAQVRRTITQRRSERQAAMFTASKPAVMRDGIRVTVAANVGSVDDAAVAAAHGAEGSGLVRTEVLFGHERERPSVTAQTERFLELARVLDGRPITIRTWDVGGDKPLSFLPQPQEANPFLGERGLRLMRRQPDALREQLSAVCLAARETAVRVMFPMVSTLEEVEWALDQLTQAGVDAGGAVPSQLKVGIMVEVPAAALRVGLLARDLDFVSIGTNDLAQYVLAAERGNAAVAPLADALDPTVLGLIGEVCDKVDEDTDVAVCGDLASDPLAAPLLVGLGVRELSVVARAVPVVKGAIRSTTVDEARQRAGVALGCASASQVRALLRGT